MRTSVAGKAQSKAPRTAQGDGFGQSRKVQVKTHAHREGVLVLDLANERRGPNRVMKRKWHAAEVQQGNTTRQTGK